MNLGPLMIDLQSIELHAEERELLLHPLLGGVILFARNYESPAQIAALTRTIHGLRTPALLVAVDHEGGRIQRFRQGFTPLPPARALGRLYDRAPYQARRLALRAGWLMAAELRAVGVDFSFAPVLDLARGVSTVIGDRAFHPNPGAVIALARAYLRGMSWAGMAAVGKHFPGHGSVVADSHFAVPVDTRSWPAIQSADLVPFAQLVRFGLPALMPAHVVYSALDPRPAGFSRFWLQKVLRGRLGFAGAIISDDLSMAGAGTVDGLSERVHAALSAGCDLALVCHGADYAALLDNVKVPDGPLAHLRLLRLQGRPLRRHVPLHQNPAWQKAVRAIATELRFLG
jgi:beta-N-acetylhexosaminidase